MTKLKIKTLSGYNDKPEILMHACFQLLVDFIEKEKPGKVINWYHCKEYAKAWRQMLYLYRWWKVIVPNREKIREDLFKGLDEPKFETEWKKIDKLDENGENLLQYCPDRKKYKAYYDAIDELNRIEHLWEKEDQRNLLKLVSIRRYMWT